MPRIDPRVFDGSDETTTDHRRNARTSSTICVVGDVRICRRLFAGIDVGLAPISDIY